MHWNVRGEGTRQDREGGLRGGPTLRSQLPARESGSPYPSPAPGRVPDCSLFPAPSAKWLKGEGSLRVEEEGCVWRGGLPVPGGVACGRDVETGGARTRAPARFGNGWSLQGLSRSGWLGGRRSRCGTLVRLLQSQCWGLKYACCDFLSLSQPLNCEENTASYWCL